MPEPANQRVSCLVVGRNSFLANRFLESPVVAGARAISHTDFAATALDDIGCIINFALHPHYRTQAYSPTLDFDRRIMERIQGTGIHYILLSSRKVYDEGTPLPWPETAPKTNGTGYGTNKLITENFARRTLGNNLTVLRMANIFGFEPGRSSFMGQAQDSLLQNGHITLDTHPEVRRDFLPVDRFVEILDHIAQRRLTGLFNLGSGVATPIGRMAHWLMEGFGAGKLVVTNPGRRDEFLLDVNRLTQQLGPLCTPDRIQAKCLELGERLRHET